MPLSAVRTFTDPDDYAASIRRSTNEVTVIGRGQFAAKLTRIDLHGLWLQRLSENLPRILHCASETGRSAITFRTHPGPSLAWSGKEMQPSNIRRHAEGEAAFQRSSGSANFAAMSLPVEEMALLGATIGRCDLAPPTDPVTVTPAPAAMARLQRLHAEAGRLAEEAPEIIANPEAARGLEQALIEAMISCLGNGGVGEDTAAQRRHEAIMRRFRVAVEAHPDRPLYVSDLCSAIGVSERTLQYCCQEQLGMGPKRYLLLRRTRLARRALREADLITGTVTEIATRFGFWELGRFAVQYRFLFGESPSATLRGPPDSRPQRAVGFPRVFAEIA